MVTTVGISENLETVVPNLLKLEFAAIEAYEAAIERFESAELKAGLSEFRQDHLQHVEALRELCREIGVDAPDGPDAKVLLTTGKVKMADMVGGDKAILTAMKTNEDDTVMAYKRCSKSQSFTGSAMQLVAKALQDEIRHRDWMTDKIKELDKRAA